MTPTTSSVATVPTTRSHPVNRQQSTSRPRALDPLRVVAPRTDAAPPDPSRLDAPAQLVAVGVAIHSFTEPLRSAVRVTAVDAHRATAMLTKQILAVLDGDDRLRSIHRLVTDPTRTAMPDGRTAEQFARTGWPLVCSVAEQRAGAAIDGALVYGETAILRLAATRAAHPDIRWWGTPAWADAVQQWAAETAAGHRLVTQLLRTPESAHRAALTAVLDR